MFVDDVACSLVLSHGTVVNGSILFLQYTRVGGYKLHLVADCASATTRGSRVARQTDVLLVVQYIPTERCMHLVVQPVSRNMEHWRIGTEHLNYQKLAGMLAKVLCVEVDERSPSRVSHKSAHNVD